MRRILLICASVAILALPAAAGARNGAARPGAGFLVVRNAANDGGVSGNPVVTVVVDGFVIGRVSQEGRVSIYHVASGAGSAAPLAVGVDVSRRPVSWRGVPGTEFTGSSFRFRAVGGVYRVVVRGSGVSIFAGGRGRATLRGSLAYPGRDGHYAFDGGRFRSLPERPLTRSIGAR